MSLYTEEELLDRVYSKLETKRTTKNQLAVVKPKIKRKFQFSVIDNFNQINYKIEKYNLNLKQFIEDELSATTKVSSDGSLSIRGSFSQQRIENVIKKLIEQQIECSVCGSINTKYKTRKGIKKLECNDCQTVKLH